MTQNIYSKRLETKSDKELEIILNNRQSYTIEAILAAIEILKKRNGITEIIQKAEDNIKFENEKNRPGNKNIGTHESIINKIKYPNLKWIILGVIFIVTVFLVVDSEASNNEMTESEKELAIKYNAERFYLNFTFTSKKTNGKLTQERKYISVSLINTNDIERIINDNDYANVRSEAIARFLLDSVELDDAPFEPQELQIDFVEESQFLLYQNETTKTVTFNLN